MMLALLPLNCFCRASQTCKGSKWSGMAGPTIPYSRLESVETLLSTLIDQVCFSSDAVLNKCIAALPLFTQFETALKSLCSSSPDGAAVCTFGINSGMVAALTWWSTCRFACLVDIHGCV